ncbi:MAG: hypothetical protein NZL90_04645 [Aquificaceae bacterium]|nr:hypothetical protein [Aquificaceae bacterium]MDW8237834.1 hypothetical protein [Aquificaceae bacterium]
MRGVLILTEASRKMGYGHLSRCVSLKQALSKAKVFTKLYVRGDDSAKAFAKDAVLFEWLNWDKTYLKALSKRYFAVVIDSYYAPEEFYQECARVFKAIIAMDDFKRLSGEGLCILNPGLYASEMGYLGKNHMLGPKFALLRKPFWGNFFKKIRARSARFLLTFGGEDIRGLTPRFVRALKSAFGLELLVVIGHGSSLGVCELDGVRVYRALNALGMRRLMERADIVLSAGGQTTFELACVGLGGVLISVADNQVLNCQSWHSSGVFTWAGNWDDENLETKVLSGLSEFFSYEKRLRSMVLGRNQVDGLGVFRVVRQILELN